MVETVYKNAKKQNHHDAVVYAQTCIVKINRYIRQTNGRAVKKQQDICYPFFYITGKQSVGSIFLFSVNINMAD